MSLTASMWTSVSGLLAHGEKMNVIGNNISNVNTVGYKSQRMDFQDFVYQYVGTANGMGQVGRGTNIGIIMNDYSQGSHETTTSATDIAITGNGFFSVKPKTNNVNYYTRAGNFSFDREGYLVDPHGYVLQGWAVDRNYANQTQNATRNTKGIVGSGSPVDIKLDTFTCPPRHTTNMTMPINLNNTAIPADDDKSTDVVDPFFALLKTWDATQNPPLGTSKYAHQSTIEVYDEAGKMHKLTVYFDRVVNDNGGQDILGNSSESYWEYIITMDPSEDIRDFNSVYDPTGASPTSPNVPENLKGLLGAGTFTFTSNGDMKDMTCFVPNSKPGDATDQWWGPIPGGTGEVVDLNKWVAAPISSNGYPMIAPNFSGTGGQQTAYGYNAGAIDPSKPNPNATDRLIAVNFGMRLTDNSWAFPSGQPDVTLPDGTTVSPNAPTNADGLVTAGGMSNVKFRIAGMDGKGVFESPGITNYEGGFFEHTGFKQDGYTYGDLRYVNVSPDGVLSAAYSNGVTLQLYQVVLYDFPSNQNLRREGGNLFTETRESGVPSSGAAGTGTFGTTAGYSLEQSNVDLSREFVNMITTQRGFQANSKTITTVDTMLETVIGMKR